MNPLKNMHNHQEIKIDKKKVDSQILSVFQKKLFSEGTFTIQQNAKLLTRYSEVYRYIAID